MLNSGRYEMARESMRRESPPQGHRVGFGATGSQYHLANSYPE